MRFWVIPNSTCSSWCMESV